MAYMEPRLPSILPHNLHHHRSLLHIPRILKYNMSTFMFFSLESKHLIWVWIINVLGAQNRADFIEVLCGS